MRRKIRVHVYVDPSDCHECGKPIEENELLYEAGKEFEGQRSHADCDNPRGLEDL